MAHQESQRLNNAGWIMKDMHICENYVQTKAAMRDLTIRSANGCLQKVSTGHLECTGQCRLQCVTAAFQNDITFSGKERTPFGGFCIDHLCGHNHYALELTFLTQKIRLLFSEIVLQNIIQLHYGRIMVWKPEGNQHTGSHLQVCCFPGTVNLCNTYPQFIFHFSLFCADHRVGIHRMSAEGAKGCTQPCYKQEGS